MSDEAIAQFERCGLDPREAKGAAQNAKLCKNLLDVLGEARCSAGSAEGFRCEKALGMLLFTIAAKFPPHACIHRPLVVSNCVDKKIKSSAQLEAAMRFCAEAVTDTPLDVAAFEGACGIGISVSMEEIDAAIDAVFAQNASRLSSERYRCLGTLLGQLRSRKELKWADGKSMKAAFDAKALEVLGEKTEADMAKPKKEKKPKTEKKIAQVEANVDAAATEEEADSFNNFPPPDVNDRVHTEVIFSDGKSESYRNTREILGEHLKETESRVVTRFPPEPNGYLHIGHAKACFIDFGLAKKRNGITYLRYDDTNPEAEKQEYIDHIQEIVGWLGWHWHRVTYSSDYFDKLYDLAEELIKRDKAYVCHQSGPEIKLYREQQKDSPYRNRPSEESLKLFREMKKGLWDEGTATLRMKGDMKNDNANMMDLIAYRIKFVEHPKAGDKWCIYPSYDFTHCIVDSLENITHSLCTVEFEVRRASYYWLLNSLDLYMPYVWEYSRLNICGNVLSKRKLNKLVTLGYVNGWDDPRLLTLSGLRRRGYTKAAINNFCQSLGVSRTENLIPLHKLEHFIRADLNQNAPRAMVVLRPLKVIITNMEAGYIEQVKAFRWPNRPGAEEPYEIPLTRTLYIERDDFREEDSKGYYGLAPGKSVILRYAYPITCKEVVRDASGGIQELHCEYVPDKSIKPKGVIHWVAEPKPGVKPTEAEIRLYTSLFKSDDVNAVDDWLGDLDTASLERVTGALVTAAALTDAASLDTFQFERMGYFCADKDATPGKPVFNRTVTLKETIAAAAGKRKT